MAVWPGLGVNYKAAQSQWDKDIAYFKAIGLRNIRPHMHNIPMPWSVGTPAVSGLLANVNAYWRNCADYFHKAGFWVTWGVSVAPIGGMAQWQAYHDAVITEATYLQQQGIVVDEFEIGNELEGTNALDMFIPQGNLTQSNGLATCTTQKVHGYQTGDSITIHNATPSGYNGTFTVTVINSTTFTYTCDPLLDAAATGTGIGCYYFTIAQLHTNLRQLAADVKAVYSLGQVSYGCFDKTVGGVATYAEWRASGLGALDSLSLHPYGNITPSTQTITTNNFTNIALMISVFGNKVYLSEFNTDADNSDIIAIGDEQQTSWMQSIWSTVKGLGVPKAFVYEWCQYPNGSTPDYGYAQLRPDSSMHPQWLLFFDSLPLLYNRRTFPVRSLVDRQIVDRTQPIRNMVY